jgi:Tfp pilus assembly protein PilX
MNVRLHSSSRHQRGAASLIVALVLLFGGTLIAA